MAVSSYHSAHESTQNLYTKRPFQRSPRVKIEPFKKDKIAHGSKVSFHGKIGVIIRLKDVSVYTVVFDDGDEKTLKRGSLCIKGKIQLTPSI